MPECPFDSSLIAITVAVEALELRLAEAGPLVSEALADAARGRLTRAVGTVVPLVVMLPEASALIASVLVMHRHSRGDGEVPPGLFPE